MSLCLSDVCSSLVPELLLTVLLFKFYIPFDGLSDVIFWPVCPLNIKDSTETLIKIVKFKESEEYFGR